MSSATFRAAEETIIQQARRLQELCTPETFHTRDARRAFETMCEAFKALDTMAGEPNGLRLKRRVDSSTIEALKALRAYTGLGLKETKDIIDRVGFEWFDEMNTGRDQAWLQQHFEIEGGA